MTVALIAAGGALGSLLRYGLGAALVALLGSSFPYGTLAANVLGSFGLGVIAEALDGRAFLGADLRLVLGTGLMGGFTTYSSFNLETLRLAQAGELGRALVYVVATMILCLLVGLAGIALARALRG